MNNYRVTIRLDPDAANPEGSTIVCRLNNREDANVLLGLVFGEIDHLTVDIDQCGIEEEPEGAAEEVAS